MHSQYICAGKFKPKIDWAWILKKKNLKIKFTHFIFLVKFKSNKKIVAVNFPSSFPNLISILSLTLNIINSSISLFFSDIATFLEKIENCDKDFAINCMVGVKVWLVSYTKCSIAAGSHCKIPRDTFLLFEFKIISSSSISEWMSVDLLRILIFPRITYPIFLFHVKNV